ncbi:MAG: inorganic diphosphatase [Microthrixaceae bacterium]
MSDQERYEVVIEIPKGSRNKYEVDHESGEVWLDRYLYTATTYPADYGFFPNTLGGDGDPLDALVLLNESVFPGCHLWVRPLGVFHMQDEAGDDAKILCALAGDHRWDHLQRLGDVQRSYLDEIGHFFEVYKALEPGKEAEVGEWADRDDAVAELDAAFKRYRDTPH